MEEDMDEDSSVFFGVFIGTDISLLDVSSCLAGNFNGIVAGLRGLEIICFTVVAAGFKDSNVDFGDAIILNFVDITGSMYCFKGAESFGLFTTVFTDSMDCFTGAETLGLFIADSTDIFCSVDRFMATFNDVAGSMDCFKGAEILDLVAAIFTDTGIAVDLASLLISDFLFAADSVDICSSMDCFRKVEGAEISDLITAGSVDTLMDTGMEGLVITAGFTVDSTDMDEGNLDIKDAINGFTVSFLGMEVIFVSFIGAGTGMRGLVMLTVAAAVKGFEVGITGVDVEEFLEVCTNTGGLVMTWESPFLSMSDAAVQTRARRFSRT